MSDTLKDRALASAQTATADAAAKRNAKFAKLLKDTLDLEAQPTSPEIIIDGVRFRLEGERIRVYHDCPKCQAILPGNYIYSLEDLGVEIGRPLVGHNCRPPKEEAISPQPSALSPAEAPKE